MTKDVCERLVQSVKEVMTRAAYFCSLLLQLTRAASLLKEKVLTDPQLATLLTEVESIFTNRPLTHISTDSEDLEVLTPNHILLGLQKQWGFVTDVDKKDVTS